MLRLMEKRQNDVYLTKNFKIMNGNLGIYIKEKIQPGLSILKKAGVKNEWGLSNWSILNVVF